MVNINTDWSIIQPFLVKFKVNENTMLINIFESDFYCKKCKITLQYY